MTSSLQGETSVVCGVKLELAEPRPEAPDQGFVVPNLELSPICHPQFKPGPPSELAQTVSNFLLEVRSVMRQKSSIFVNAVPFYKCLY